MVKHIELLNEDVSYLETFTMLPCCNACNSEGGGGGCSCQTYVCGVGNVTCSCGNVGAACNVCNLCESCNVCGLFNYG